MKPITPNTRFALTPAGYAALGAAQPARRLTRKRRLIPALAAKRTGLIMRSPKQSTDALKGN